MSEKHGDKYLQLGLSIAYYRKMRGMNQEVLAERIGISRTHMSNIEAPKLEKSLSLDVLFDISDALDVAVGKLFELR